MRIDLPLCNFKYCKYCLDGNCTAKEIHRERCEFLIREPLTEPEPLTLEQLEARNNPVWVRLEPPYINNCKGYWCLCQEGHITPPSCMPFEAEYRPNWTFYDKPPKEPRHEQPRL